MLWVVSSGKATILKDTDNFFLRLEGNVSTKNNGGFIQVRSSKEIVSDNFKGIKLKVSGKPSEYYIHIRTNFLLMPWQYYAGKFSVDKEWKYVEVYFEDFKKSNFYQPSAFSATDIKSVGFVAYGKDFEAELNIMELNYFSMSEKKNNFPKTKVKNPNLKLVTQIDNLGMG